MITVTAANKTHNYGLNGETMHLRQVLDLFFESMGTATEASLRDKVVRLNTATVEASDFGQVLRDGDVITIISAQVARGGVKGALTGCRYYATLVAWMNTSGTV